MKLHRIFAGGAGILASAVLLAPAAEAAAVSLTGAAYSQNFDTLAASGLNQSSLPAGWEISESGGGARDNDLYSADNGGSTTGDTYSYGTGTNADRALGSLGSGSLGSIFGAIFQNMTGTTITAVTLDYTGEQWRNGSASADSLRFQYRVGATSVSTGTWTDFSDLDFDSIIGGGAATLNGNAAANRVSISGTFGGLTIANNSSFGIRWVDVDVAGGEDGLAIDDLTLTTTPSAVPEPATWGLMVLGFAALGAMLRRRRTMSVRFS